MAAIDLAFEADGIWGNFNDTFSVPQLPFLFSSYEDVDARLINGEGGKYMSDLLESSFSVKCLGIGENCPLKSKFLLPRLKAASVYGFDKGNLYIKQISSVDSLLGPVTFLTGFLGRFSL